MQRLEPHCPITHQAMQNEGELLMEGLQVGSLRAIIIELDQGVNVGIALQMFDDRTNEGPLIRPLAVMASEVLAVEILKCPVYQLLDSLQAHCALKVQAQL